MFLLAQDLIPRHPIGDTAEQDDGSIVVHVRKQYNDKADVSEYFE